MLPSYLELLGHIGDDKGLADGLAAGDTERAIPIGFRAVRRFDLLARSAIDLDGQMWRSSSKAAGRGVLGGALRWISLLGDRRNSS